jgi:hypothetical protein
MHHVFSGWNDASGIRIGLGREYFLVSTSIEALDH